MTAEETNGTLTLADKINRLFDACRGRDELEQTPDHVAWSINRLIGRPISADQIRALRTDSALPPDPDIIDGLVRHFAVPAEYLTTTGPHAERVDKQLRLLVAARDAGVKRLALRGGSLDSDDLHGVLDAVKRIPTAEL